MNSMTIKSVPEVSYMGGYPRWQDLNHTDIRILELVAEGETKAVQSSFGGTVTRDRGLWNNCKAGADGDQESRAALRLTMLSD